jgi:2-methylcitrate dehydratase PrpD
MEYASQLVLDSLANAIAGSVTDAGRKVIQWGREQSSMDAGRLAFLMSVLSQLTELDDIHANSLTHPGAVVVPAALAASLKEGVTGEVFLKSVLHGYEATCLIGQVLKESEFRSIDHSSICGSLGAAMAVTSILQLSDLETAAVLANLIAREVRHWDVSDAGTLSKYFNIARASELGITGSYLAQVGVFDGVRNLNVDQDFYVAAERELASVESYWALTQTTIRTLPCCRHVHPAIEAALALREQLTGKAIRKIRVITYKGAKELCDRPDPIDEYDARFSIQYCVAHMLSFGHIGLASFENYHCATLAKIRQKICVEIYDQFTQRFPAELGAKLVVSTEEGADFSSMAYCHKNNSDIDVLKRIVTEKARLLLATANLDEFDYNNFLEITMSIYKAEKLMDVTSWFY